MSQNADGLLHEALGLPASERADLAAELLASLDRPSEEDPVALQRLWAEEIERRARRALAGESKAEDWAVARERIARSLTDG